LTTTLGFLNVTGEIIFSLPASSSFTTGRVLNQVNQNQLIANQLINFVIQS
jgi:hypothetical protein